MKYLFSRESEPLIGQLAWSRVLLAFDFDGTLAPIVVDRDGAAMHSSTTRLLTRLCTLFPCAVISGRGRADVLSRLHGAPVKYVIGNHGLEPGVELESFEADLRRAHESVEWVVDRFPGVEIEDKRYSLAVHYRKSKRKRDARVAIRDALSRVPLRIRVIPGKAVVNVVPAVARNKGDALIELRAREGADTALYIGDDATDEDVFALDQPGRLFAVRIGESRQSAATYFLRNQREVDRLLLSLIARREARSVG